MTPQRFSTCYVARSYIIHEVAHNHSLWVCYKCLSDQLSHTYVSMYMYVCMYVFLYVVCMYMYIKALRYLDWFP